MCLVNDEPFVISHLFYSAAYCPRLHDFWSDRTSQLMGTSSDRLSRWFFVIWNTVAALEEWQEFRKHRRDGLIIALVA